METHGIPESIIDTIAKNIHIERFQEGIKQAIDTLATPFERAIEKYKDFITVLNQKISHIFVDSNYEFITVVLETHCGTYIVYHEYSDRFYDEKLVMEIAIDSATQGRLLRFYNKINERVCTDFAAYYANRNYYNPILFHYLEEIAQMDEGALADNIVDEINIQWRNPDDLIAWFRSNEPAFEDLAADRFLPTETPL